MPGRLVDQEARPALRRYRSIAIRTGEHILHADRWQETGLVFTTAFGTAMDAPTSGVTFRRALHLVPGIDPEEWTPRELRHSFVSVLSDAGIPLEEISRLVGHSGTTVAELVYRHQLKLVLQTGDRDGPAVQAED
jgi:integrase